MGYMLGFGLGYVTHGWVASISRCPPKFQQRVRQSVNSPVTRSALFSRPDPHCHLIMEGQSGEWRARHGCGC